MSYILDALRRADAERTRGAVPGLHAQSVPTDGEPAARNFSPLIWGAGVAGALLVAVVVVLAFAPWRAQPDGRVAALPLAPAPELAPVAREAAPAPVAPGELPPAQPGALDPGARPIEPPMARDRAPPSYAPAQRPPARDPRPARVATLESPPAASAPATVEHYGAPVVPAATAARPAAIPALNDLPADVRSQLPHLNVGGSIYSETPAARMVILNGQVFHEGDKPAADTVLEQIRLKSAIFNFRGQRYEVAF